MYTSVSNRCHDDESISEASDGRSICSDVIHVDGQRQSTAGGSTARAGRVGRTRKMD